MKRLLFVVGVLLFAALVTSLEDNSAEISFNYSLATPETNAAEIEFDYAPNGTVDYCAWSGTGNFTIPCYCNITTNLNLAGNALIFNDTGNSRITAAVANASNLIVREGCNVTIQGASASVEVN